jgi:hypothetical protein
MSVKLLEEIVKGMENGQFSPDQLIGVLQGFVDSEDVLAHENEGYVISLIFPFLDRGALSPSRYTDLFAERMNSKVVVKASEIRKEKDNGDLSVITAASLLECAELVGKILSAYIAIHTDIFALRWYRWTPLGRWFYSMRLDFHNHFINLRALEKELEKIQSTVRKTRDEMPKLSTVLYNYCGSLKAALHQLGIICAGLDASYSWREYRRDFTDYEKRVKAYKALGVTLNQELSQVQNGHS